MCGKTGSKKVSAEWVKNQFGSAFRDLIEVAENWKYGKQMFMKNETINFIKFAIDRIKETNLYQKMYDND